MGKIVAAMATMHAPQLFTRPPEEDPKQLDAGIAAMRKLGQVLDRDQTGRFGYFRQRPHGDVLTCNPCRRSR